MSSVAVLDDSKTSNSIITVPRKSAKYTSSCSRVRLPRSPAHTGNVLNMLLKQPISLGKMVWKVKFWVVFVGKYLQEYVKKIKNYSTVPIRFKRVLMIAPSWDQFSEDYPNHLVTDPLI